MTLSITNKMPTAETSHHGNAAGCLKHWCHLTQGISGRRQWWGLQELHIICALAPFRELEGPQGGQPQNTTSWSIVVLFFKQPIMQQTIGGKNLEIFYEPALP